MVINKRRGIGLLGLCLGLAGVGFMWAGCTPSAYDQTTAPLGEDVIINAGFARTGSGSDRGVMGIGFINRTPYRAIGTFGGYDPQDQQTIVVFGQLGVAPIYDLEPNEVNFVFAMPTTRAFSVGGGNLITLIFQNELESQQRAMTSFVAGVNLGAFVPSLDLLKQDIGFSGAPLNDPQGSIPTQGTADGLTVFLGTDYQYDSILIFEFYEDATTPGGFRTDFTTARDLGVDVERLIQLAGADRAVALEPLGLDRERFQLLSSLGVPSVTGPQFVISAGTDPTAVELDVSNGSTQTLSLALFGPDDKVVRLAPGGSSNFKVPPGTYEFLIIPSTQTGAVQLGTQTLNAGTAGSLPIVAT